MIKIQNQKLTVVSTPNLPIGHLGIAYHSEHRFNASVGDLIDVESLGLTKFFLSWAFCRDVEQACYNLPDEVNIVETVFVNRAHRWDLDVDYDVAAKPSVKVVETVKEVTVGAVPFVRMKGGLKVVICETLADTDEQFPDYSARMSDQTRGYLGLSWETSCRIEGRSYKVKPAFSIDLGRITDPNLQPRTIFLTRGAIEDGDLPIYSPPQFEETGELKNLSDSQNYLQKIVGDELVKDFESELISYPRSVSARVYYKTIAKGVAAAETSEEALREALRTSLRAELILVRDRINETIDRIHPN